MSYLLGSSSQSDSSLFIVEVPGKFPAKHHSQFECPHFSGSFEGGWIWRPDAWQQNQNSLDGREQGAVIHPFTSSIRQPAASGSS